MRPFFDLAPSGQHLVHSHPCEFIYIIWQHITANFLVIKAFRLIIHKSIVCYDMTSWFVIDGFVLYAVLIIFEK